jgi:hypothetical protein
MKKNIGIAISSLVLRILTLVSVALALPACHYLQCQP